MAFSTKLYNNKLEILPLKKLQDSTTYHILITSTLLDLHGNPISPYNLIFSTGPNLDSGSIRGCIINPAKKNAQYRIALFTKKELVDSGICGTPSYLLQTDTMGRFNAGNLKIDSYQAIAYIDANNDAHLQSATESAFTPVDSFIFIDQQTPEVTFFPSEFDTSFPRITNLKAVNNKLISANWNKTYDSLVFLAPTIRIDRINPLQQLQNAKYIPLNNSPTFTVLSDVPLDIAPYRIISSIIRIFDNKTFSDTVLFNGNNIIDTIFPRLQLKPDTNTALDLSPTIKFIWSKPVSFITPLFLKDQTGDSISTILSAGYSDTTFIIPASQLQAGTVYSIYIKKNMARDLYGNGIFSADSADTSDTILIKTIDNDSLASSLQGTTTCEKFSEKRLWFYVPLSSPDKKYFSLDSAGTFCFNSIIAGKGHIGYFSDKNKNRIADKGRIYPWHAPEPFIISTDTVEARARWDVEGITVSPCDLCQYTLSDSARTDTDKSNKQ